MKTATLRYTKLYFLLFVAVFFSYNSYSTVDSLILQVDLPSLNSKDHLTQEFYYTTAVNRDVNVSIVWYYIKRDTDTIKVININKVESKLSSKKHVQEIANLETTRGVFVNDNFSRAVKSTNGLFPVGKYYGKVLIVSGKDTLSDLHFEKIVDSNITPTSSFRKAILDFLQEQNTGKKVLNDKSLSKLRKQYGDKGASLLNRTDRKLDKFLAARSMVHQRVNNPNKDGIDFYSGEFYMGQIDIVASSSFSNMYKTEKDKIRNLSSDITNTGLENFESLNKQLKKLAEQDDEEKNLVGNIFINGTTGNGQEPNSMQSNTYYEVGGDVAFPVLGIPINLVGFYTSQDRGRSIKSSNFKISYDAAKAKEKVTQLITAFSGQYENVKSKGLSYEMVYKTYLEKLKTEKLNSLSSLKNETGFLKNIDLENISETQLKELSDKEIAKIASSATDKADSLGNTSAAKKNIDSLTTVAKNQYEKALKQYKKIKDYEQKIQHYTSLLDQYSKSGYYDSLLAYSKIKDMKDMENLSAKDMAKKAENLLPNGKAKSALMGLTNFDLGTLSNYVSEYTQSGQMFKGIDVGYDIGVAEIGGSYGSTEYIGRSGDIEKYKIVGLRTKLKPVLKQSIGFVYYNYSPAKNLFKDTSFFKPQYFSVSSFSKPTHIVSVTYDGTIGKSAKLIGEFATSNQKARDGLGDGIKAGIASRSAYNIGVEGTIPETNIAIMAKYESVGKDFENNTMPVLLAGIQRASVGGDGIFFNSFLKIGVEYSYLLQNSFGNTGKNNKWGFTAATRSKRYPSISLSYKPFATFRTFDDTMQIQQKPVLGEVWTGKLNYQLKRRTYNLRFVLVGNKNLSIVDTLKYGSATLQFSTIFNTKKTNLGANIAYSTVNSSQQNTLFPAFNNTTTIALSGGRNLKEVGLNGNVEMGISEMGISKYGLGLNALYRFQNAPIMIRINCRTMKYKLSDMDPWSNLLFAGIDLNWQLKMKLSN